MPSRATVLIIIGGLFIPIMTNLAAIAIPAYQNYIVCSPISRGLALSGRARAAGVEYYVQHGVFVTGNMAAGLAQSQSLPVSI